MPQGQVTYNSSCNELDGASNSKVQRVTEISNLLNSQVHDMQDNKPLRPETLNQPIKKELIKITDKNTPLSYDTRLLISIS